MGHESSPSLVWCSRPPWPAYSLHFPCDLKLSPCCYLVTESCPTLCDPMNHSPPGSFVHRILQARIQEWVAISFSRGLSQLRDRIRAFSVAGGFSTSDPQLSPCTYLTLIQSQGTPCIASYTNTFLHLIDSWIYLCSDQPPLSCHHLSHPTGGISREPSWLTPDKRGTFIIWVLMPLLYPLEALSCTFAFPVLHIHLYLSSLLY